MRAKETMRREIGLKVRRMLCFLMDEASRRRERANKLVWGKATSFADHEQQGIEFWRSASYAAKWQAIIELVRDSRTLEGHDGPEPRLDRSAYGIAKLGG
jgi:hypothetical protein